MEQKQVSRTIKAKMDIVLCVDSTGSMSPCIDGLRANLKSLISGLGGDASDEQRIKPDWRARVIGFRDRAHDGPNWILEHPFVNDEAALASQLDNLEARGGGDRPESMLDVLYIAMTQSDWGEDRLHAVVAFSDVEPHGKLHPDTIEPGQPDGIGTVVQPFTADKLSKLWLFVPKHETYEELKKIRGSVVEYVDGAGDVYKGLQNLKWDDLLETLGKTIALSSARVATYRPS